MAFKKKIKKNLHARIIFHALTSHRQREPPRFPLHHSPSQLPLFCPTERRGGRDLLLFGNCSFSHHLTDGREKYKSSLFLKKGGGEAAQALNIYTIKFWHSFQFKSPQKQQIM